MNKPRLQPRQPRPEEREHLASLVAARGYDQTVARAKVADAAIAVFDDYATDVIYGYRGTVLMVLWSEDLTAYEVFIRRAGEL